MNICKYNVVTESKIVKDHPDQLKAGEHISFKAVAGKTTTVTVILGLAETIIEMQKNMADMNKNAAQAGDPLVCNCMNCRDRENCASPPAPLRGT